MTDPTKTQATTKPRQVIRDYPLSLAKTGQFAKGPIVVDRAYTIIRYQTYDALGRCDLCEHEHKAGKQALIRDEVTGLQYQSGTHCLAECLGCTEGELERAVSGRRVLAARVGRMTKRHFNNEGEMLDTLSQAFSALPADHPEVSRCIASIERYRDCIPLTDDQQERLGVILDFYALLHEATFQPELYQARLRALELDPCHAKQSPVNWALYTDPTALTVARVERLKDVMKAAAKRMRDVKLPDPQFKPWDYDSEADYQAAARAHYTALAERGQVQPDVLQAAYDTQQFNYEIVHGEKMRHRTTFSDFMGLIRVPGTVPVVSSSPWFGQDWLKASTRRDLEVRDGLHRMSLDRGYHAPDTIHTGNVRTDPPEQRYDRDGKLRAVRAEHVGSVSYRCAAFWPSAPWREVYGLWAQYRAEGGRAFLLSFPAAPEGGVDLTPGDA